MRVIHEKSRQLRLKMRMDGIDREVKAKEKEKKRVRRQEAATEEERQKQARGAAKAAAHAEAQRKQWERWSKVSQAEGNRKELKPPKKPKADADKLTLFMYELNCVNYTRLQQGLPPKSYGVYEQEKFRAHLEELKKTEGARKKAMEQQEDAAQDD